MSRDTLPPLKMKIPRHEKGKYFSWDIKKTGKLFWRILMKQTRKQNADEISVADFILFASKADSILQKIDRNTAHVSYDGF